jgi:hypothetical protein
MTPTEMESLIRTLDLRTLRIEQILPTLATKEDLKAFATKDDLKALATKEDLAETKRYALILHEDVKADLRLLAEHLVAVMERLDRLERRG